MNKKYALTAASIICFVLLCGLTIPLLTGISDDTIPDVRIGEPVEDTTCITLEEARNICAEFDGSGYNSPEALERALAEEFNKIAGAPDFEGGSGITVRAYYTDETHNGQLMITLGHVLYRDQATGEQETLY